MQKIIIGSLNDGKVAELRALLGNVRGFRFVGLSDIDIDADAPETHDTFKENAIEKAKFYENLLWLPCVADDSGLEVEALGGAPGIFSARWTGEHADGESNRRKLVEELQKLGIDESPARYVCAMALVSGERVSVFEGELCGVVKIVPHGGNGFAYDPNFYLPDGRTIADLAPWEKNIVSHRGIAARKLAEFLADHWDGV